MVEFRNMLGFVESSKWNLILNFKKKAKDIDEIKKRKN
jgi:hypothetical protein